MTPKLKYRWLDWWQESRPILVCKVIGHPRGPGVRKFGGEILCRRCYKQVGRWSV